MNTKFTPGPWETRPAHETNEMLEKDNTYHRITSGEGYRDATTGHGFEVTGFMNAANARLIASAPEMFELLEEVSPLIDEIIHRLPTGNGRNEICDFNIKLKSLLTKITTPSGNGG